MNADNKLVAAYFILFVTSLFINKVCQDTLIIIISDTSKFIYIYIYILTALRQISFFLERILSLE